MYFQQLYSFINFDFFYLAEHQPGEDWSFGGKDQVGDGHTQRENGQDGGRAASLFGSGKNVLRFSCKNNYFNE